MHIDQNILTVKEFENLFNTFYVRLCRTSYRIVQDQHKAEDVVQETFCNLWRKREALQHVTSIEGYLLRSVYNTSLNALKKDKAQHFKTLEEETTKYSASTSPNPAQQLQFAETQEAVNKAVNSLPPACRTVFVLSRFENRTNKEIASELNLSVKTVENQMTKALRLLRQALLLILLFFQNTF